MVRVCFYSIFFFLTFCCIFCTIVDCEQVIAGEHMNGSRQHSIVCTLLQADLDLDLNITQDSRSRLEIYFDLNSKSLEELTALQ